MTLRNLNVSSCQTRSVETATRDGHAPGVATTCAGDNTVAALIAGALDVTAARRLEVHLDGCVHCRRLIADLGRGLSAIDPQRMPSEGETVGRYTIRRAIGAGGMGVVYEAHDDVLDRRVAVKVLRPDAATSPIGERVLLAEARAMARLSHRNIVAIHDAGSTNGRVFLCMELVVGTTLREWLAAERRGAREIIAMFAAAGAGLAYIHGERVVHLDFKPANVLVDRGGRPVVTDFGVAAIVGRGTIGGTPRYMAPEQRRGEPADARADQYAFCTALGEALGAAAPSWARRAIDRGRRPKAHERFTSMPELLAVLAAGLGRMRRRVVAVAGVAAALALSLAIARSPRLITRVIDHAATERIVEHVTPGTAPVSAAATMDVERDVATLPHLATSASALALDRTTSSNRELFVSLVAAGIPAVVTGALTAVAHRIEPSGCDDGQPLMCQSEPPWCPPGSAIAVRSGCWTCSDEQSCAPLGVPHACDDGSPLRCSLAKPTCPGRERASVRGGCWQCADPFSCAARSVALATLPPLQDPHGAGGRSTNGTGSGVGRGSDTGKGHDTGSGSDDGSGYGSGSDDGSGYGSDGSGQGSAHCGNGFCELGEDHASCPADCCEMVGSGCAPVCGDSICEAGEDFASCAADCCPVGSGGSCL